MHDYTSSKPIAGSIIAIAVQGATENRRMEEVRQQLQACFRALIVDEGVEEAEEVDTFSRIGPRVKLLGSTGFYES